MTTSQPSRRAAVRAAVAAFLLHALVAAWAWRTWDYFGRGGIIAWMDFPISLAYLHLKGDAMIITSLLVGGLQWAAIAALLTLHMGRTLRRRR